MRNISILNAVFNMRNYIINSFIVYNKRTILDIYEYIKLRYDKAVEFSIIKIELSKMVKDKILFLNNKIYEPTQEGCVILNDHKFYYSRIIIRFFRKYTKIKKLYVLQEFRVEQQKLRTYLINNKEHKCVICNKQLPLCLLETAHLKPRCLLNFNEMKDNNIVELMCRYCHTLYDNGYLALYNGILCVSPFIRNYDLHYNKISLIMCYNIQNRVYFNFHYKYIYKIGT
jgi:hypothetical protein